MEWHPPSDIGLARSTVSQWVNQCWLFFTIVDVFRIGVSNSINFQGIILNVQFSACKSYLLLEYGSKSFGRILATVKIQQSPKFLITVINSVNIALGQTVMCLCNDKVIVMNDSSHQWNRMQKQEDMNSLATVKGDSWWQPLSNVSLWL